MENGLPVSIRTALAMHTRPSASVSRASYAPVVTPVTFTRSSWSTAPSGSLAHWLGPKADVPAGAGSSDWTVEDVRFQKRVSFAAAGSARMIAAALSRIANFIILPLALAPMANDDGAPHQPTQRLKATLSGRLLSFGGKRLPNAPATLLTLALVTLALPLAANADPLEVKVGVLRDEHSRETISILDIPPADDFIAGARMAMADNNTTGKFLDQSFTIEDVKLGADDDPAAAVRALIDKGVRYLIVDLPADGLLKVADAAKEEGALVFNAGAPDDSLREQDCRANVIHTAPSRSML